YFEQISKWAFATTATMAVPLAGNVGISEKDNNQFNIYPNPVTNQLSIISNSKECAKVNLSLMDALGREVESVRNLDLPANFNMGSLPNGNYFLRLEYESAGLVHSQNIIKR
ncbi:MAG: hypothetical protein ACI8P5_001925, partial [Bacteroidia bacterium]